MNIKYPIKHPHTLSIEEALNAFQTDINQGISASEAEKRTNEFGPNVYQEQKQKSVWYLLLGQFRSPIIYLLVIAASVSLYFRNDMEALAIAIVILINALIGFFMEMQARSSMNALKEMDVILSKVTRDGKNLEIPSEKITTGDIVVLETGNVIPGDGRLVESNHLQCDESSLTGESLPTEKNTEELPEKKPIGDRFNMVFKGTSVMNGNGKAIITGIAHNTELGMITSLVEASPEKNTPLDKKIKVLSKKLIWIMLAMVILFAVTGFIQGKNWMLLFETTIALAVAAFPEGLPIVATVALAYGMLQMTKRNAIVKKLSAVETLGGTNVILTDKTGTLTENKIYVEILSFPEGNVDVKIDRNAIKFDDAQMEKSQENFEKLILIGALCNNASPESVKGKKKITGDPIEIALLTLSNASGPSAKKLKNQYKRIDEVPFNSETKIMGTLHKNGKSYFVSAKGSVEHLLEKCGKIQSGETIKRINGAKKTAILSESEKMAANGLRVLAFAYREDSKKISPHDYLDDLIYVGMVGFLDPPRLDIKSAILFCREAGIKVVMITGDHPQTALNIAKKTGLVDEAEKEVINGQEFPPVLSAKWKKKILSASVFARTTPKQKYDIADVYQKAGYIVAMMGDGVNDAPALKKANIGIAMGLRGTQVAKETATIVLKDDSFTSIAEAVAHGRAIFINIQKFVVYLVSCNLSEIFIVTALGFVAPAVTLLLLQILFLNMVTDIFPALALGLGKGDETVMKRPPRDPKKDIITNKTWVSISFYAIAMTFAVLAAVFYCKHAIPSSDLVANNVAFITLAFAQLFHVFNMSSLRSQMLVNEVTKNKFIWFAILLCAGLIVLVYAIPQMRTVLGLVVFSGKVWTIAVLAGLLPLLTIQIYKIIWKYRNPQAPNDWMKSTAKNLGNTS